MFTNKVAKPPGSFADQEIVEARLKEKYDGEFGLLRENIGLSMYPNPALVGASWGIHRIWHCHASSHIPIIYQVYLYSPPSLSLSPFLL